MTAPGPQIRAHDLWTAREKKCISIIERALELMRDEIDLPIAEIDLNRRFYFCLLAASREVYPEEEVAPVVECNNQPDPDDDARAKREQKRPDIQWIYLDRYEPDPNRSSKQFVVECKRLGSPSRSDWVLNANYVNHGVVRFKDPQWAYAKLARSGAMIGYWQSMKPDDVLSEVNAECGVKSLPDLGAVGTWVIGGTSRLEHLLDRAFDVSPFKLYHFWIDLTV